jgi:tetratricopeptide (TPR) repeat protein
MESQPDLTTEAKWRELLERYPENVFLKYRLASLLESQGREEEASQILALHDPPQSLKYDMGLLVEDERIRQRPDDPVAHLNRGIWHRWHGSYSKALSDYDRSIRIDPTIAYAFCALGDLRATCPDEAFRDGRLALEDARTTMELAVKAGELIGDWRHRLYLQVFAAAHAADNQFRKAIAFQARALDLALTRTTRSEISLRLELYRTGVPIRDEKGLLRYGFKPSDHAAGSPHIRQTRRARRVQR